MWVTLRWFASPDFAALKVIPDKSGFRATKRKFFSEYAGFLMKHSDSTCWTIIEAAAVGGSEASDHFAQRYGPTIRAYLTARWKNSAFLTNVDDAIQDVFIECFKQGGLLSKADRERGTGFRTFLFAATRNVALRFESRQARDYAQQPAGETELAQVEKHEADLSVIFDRAWAKSLLKEAADRQKQQAQEKGEKAIRRIELLRLRFEEGLPIREIAQKWQCNAAVLHHEYARARQEYKEALLEVVAFHHPGTEEEIQQECINILKYLG